MSPLAHLERGALPGSTCAAWVRAVYEARPHWTSDFSGEQFALGMAFYTHHETDRGEDYFRRAAASDALVDRVLPGMQVPAPLHPFDQPEKVQPGLAVAVSGAISPQP